MLTEREVTNLDPSKWKSVAVPISVWTKFIELADRNDRSV